MIEISVVIPAYNESFRISPTLRSVSRRLSGREFEIIVVDDGSSDSTAQTVRSLGIPEIRTVSYSPNRGKGYAVRRGIGESRGKTILVMDADGSATIDELEKLERCLGRGADVAIGSRYRSE